MMNKTWQFKLPEILLLPATHQLAAQQGFLALSEKNINVLSSLFQSLSAYSNLPAGLNPRKTREMRELFQQLKSKKETSIHDIKNLTQKIKIIQKHHLERKQLIKQNQLEFSNLYESDDLKIIIHKLLSPIENWLTHATLELRRKKKSKRAPKYLHEYQEFITRTKVQLQQIQYDIAQSFLLRLLAADDENNISYDDVLHHLYPNVLTDKPRQQLTKEHFIFFHRYIMSHGDTKSKLYLLKLSWIQSNPNRLKIMINPKLNQKIRWYSRGKVILARAKGDLYHQIELELQIRKLRSITKYDTNQLETVSHIHDNLNKESQHLLKLKNKLFPWIYYRKRKKIKNLRSIIEHHKEKAQNLKRELRISIQRNIIKRSRQKNSISNQISKTTQKSFFKRQINTTSHEPKQPEETQLLFRLQLLLLDHEHNPHYLQDLSNLKLAAQQLSGEEGQTIKKLCQAGALIPSKINALFLDLLNFTHKQIVTFPAPDPILIEAIKRNLIHPDQKKSLNQLVEMILLDPNKKLNANDLFQLKVLKNSLANYCDAKNTRNRYRITHKNRTTYNQHTGENYHETTLRHT